MDGYAQPSPVRMPGRLKWALGFAYFQVVANLAVGILIGSSISDAVSHGEELASPGIAYFSEYFSYIVAAAILLAAIVVTSGYTWGRTLLVVCEALAIISGVISLIGGTPSALLGVALGIAVISTLFSPAVLSWFEAKAALRGGVNPGTSPTGSD